MPKSPRTEDCYSRHLWQFKAVQDIFWVSMAVSLLWFGFYLRAVFVPIIVGLGLAYLTNPVLSYGEQKRNLPRLATIALILCGLLAVVVGSVAVLAPVLSSELQTLSSKVPEYADTLSPIINVGWLVAGAIYFHLFASVL